MISSQQSLAISVIFLSVFPFLPQAGKEGEEGNQPERGKQRLKDDGSGYQKMMERTRGKKAGSLGQ